MAVARAENDVARLTRAGKLEEAEAMRAHVDALKHEDPYTALQEQLDEAVQKEASGVFSRGWRGWVCSLSTREPSSVAACETHVLWVPSVLFDWSTV